ncbi:HEAT repeat domain-containing protein, partial [Desulfobulbus sp. TB]|nr:HEAT repeat domain-containing protein [Desulfobulbus sp. TB]
FHDIFSESIDTWNREFKTRQRLKRFGQGAVAILIAGGVFFAGNNWRANHYGRYLASQEGVFDRIEIHQGTMTGWDIFHQRHFRYESSFRRQDLEADKRFDLNIVEDKKNEQANLTGRLPILERLPRYAKNGLYSKVEELAENILGSKEKDLISSLSVQLASVRTTRSAELLLQIAKNLKNAEAAFALTQLSGDKSSLINLLENKERRVEAADALGRLGDSSVALELVKLLEDKNEEVRWTVAEALGWLGNSSVALELIKLLKDDHQPVRVYVTEALGRLGDSSAAPELVKLLEDEDEYVRGNTIEALSILGDSSFAPELVKLLADKDDFVRENAAKALSRLGVSSAVPELINSLRDKDLVVRHSVGEALGWLSDRSVLPALVELLTDDNEDVRASAAFALGELSDRSVT